MKKPNVIAGLRQEWCDYEPLCLRKKDVSNFKHPKAGHRNPSYNFIALQIWNDAFEFVMQNPQFWRINLEIHYTQTAKGDKIDFYELEPRSKYHIHEINKLCRKCMIESMRGNKALADGHKNKGVFSHVKFKIEIMRI